MGSYPTVNFFFLSLFYFNFFPNANKLCNNDVMTQICILSPNELTFLVAARHESAGKTVL